MATAAKKKAAKKKAAKPAVKKAAVAKKKLAAVSKAKPAAKASPKAKPAAKPAPKAAKPAKPAAKAAVPAKKVVGKPAVKGSPNAAAAKTAAKGAPVKKVVGKPAVKGSPKEPEKPVLTGKLVSRLVPSNANAIRPASDKAAAGKGKAKVSTRPPAPVIPLGVLPPESQQKLKASAQGVRVLAERRPEPAAKPAAKEAPAEGRLTKKELEYFERRLQEEHARIMGEMGYLESTVLKVNPRDSASEISGYSSHMADAGTDSMEREISFDIASKEGRLLVEVRDALKRIYAGTYGICEASGEPILRARLEALPWARFTIAEQEKFERKQRSGAKAAAEPE